MNIRRFASRNAIDGKMAVADMIEAFRIIRDAINIIIICPGRDPGISISFRINNWLSNLGASDALFRFWRGTSNLRANSRDSSVYTGEKHARPNNRVLEKSPSTSGGAFPQLSVPPIPLHYSFYTPST